MDPENELSPAAPAAETVEPQNTAPADTTPEVKAEEKPAEEPKKEKTPEEREIARLRRRVDNLTRRMYEARSNPSPSGSEGGTNEQSQADSESLSLSRAELTRLVEERAKQLAPTIKAQSDEIEHRKTVVEGLAEKWGQEKFDAYASDLDDALGGLQDRSGRPKPATDAILESDSPAALIEYLADPEHAAEAKALAGMTPIQAGRAIAKLELKLAESKAADKPKPSKVPAPIEPVRGGGTVNSMPPASDTKAWIAEMNRREMAGQL